MNLVKLSVIVPAFNEEKLIGRCLNSIQMSLSASAREGLDTELIVVDNNSTDRTAEIARAAGARVVFEPVNQISRARNAGGNAASGDWLLFVDADSFPDAPLMREIIGVLSDEGVVGCGSKVRMAPLPFWGRLLLETWHAISVTCKWAAGSLVLCRAEAFGEIGGFSEKLYATEEIDFSIRLKRWGRKRGQKLKILRDNPLETSPRKMEMYSAFDVLKLFFKSILHPRATFQNPDDLDLWYDGKR